MSRRQQQKETSLVRMLTYVLGVNPGEFALVPDTEGWVQVKELLKALHQEEGWRHIRATMIQDAVSRLAPSEFELDGKNIRCLTRKPPPPEPDASPPAHLYIGVRRKGWPVIKDRGLAATALGPVMLAEDKNRALKLGQRRDSEPVLVTVQANRAQDQGVMFSLHGQGTYLCDWVPADCLMGPAVEERPQAKAQKTKPKPKPKKTSMPQPDEMPGSFVVSMEDTEKPYKKKGLRKKIKWKDERRKGRRNKQ